MNRFVPAGGKSPGNARIPDLPTFEPGYHIVKFVVTSPEMPFEVPEIVYWVKGTEAPAKKTLALVKPRDGMDIPPDSLFEWGKMEKASLYLISFIQADDKKIRFSALTRKNTYRIPPTVLTEYLAPGKKYLLVGKRIRHGKQCHCRKRLAEHLPQAAFQPLTEESSMKQA